MVERQRSAVWTVAVWYSEERPIADRRLARVRVAAADYAEAQLIAAQMVACHAHPTRTAAAT